MHRDERFMAIALEEARAAAAAGEIPVGAVLAVGDELIARGHNLRETEQDATSHAEVLVIREACRVLRRWRLEDATLYVTLEPCPMCAGAIWNARVGRLVYGAPDSRAGAAGSLWNIVADRRLNHETQVTAGICEDACREVLREFFASRRSSIS